MNANLALSALGLALMLVPTGGCSSGELGPGVEGSGSGGPLFGDLAGPDFDGQPGGGGAPEAPASVGGESGCVGQTAGTESLPAALQLVVDTSGSMNQPAPGARQSKWSVTRAALLSAIERMPASTAVGVVFYPDVPITAAACFDEAADVPIGSLDGPGSPQRERIEAAFRGQAPDGGTPTHDAYRHAHRELAAAAVAGTRFAVVITDGTPTFSLGCVGTGRVSDPVDPGPLVAEAASARAQGVRTFVIGSPGSEGARESLSRMAEAGGTAPAGCSHDGPSHCHFDMTESADLARDLEQALGTITGLALSCAYDIPAPPSGQLLDPERVNVLFTARGGAPELIGRSSGQRCSEGWQYSEDGAQVLLCEGTCERVRRAEGSLSLQFGCATIVR